MGNATDQPNTWKQTQSSNQNEETNIFQMKEQEKTPEKGLKKIKASNLQNRVENNGYKDVQET